MKNYLKLIFTILVTITCFHFLNNSFEYLLNRSSSDWKTWLLFPTILLVVLSTFIVIKEIWSNTPVQTVEEDNGWKLLSKEEPPLHCEVLFTDQVPGEIPKVMKDMYDKHRISNIGHGVYTGNGLFTTYHLMNEDDEPITEKATHWRFLPKEPKFDN